MEILHSDPPAAGLEPAMQEHHGLSTVRDLLFGHQSREIHQRITLLEERLDASLAALDSRLDASLASLEERLSQRLDEIGSSLRQEVGEARERIDAERALSDQRHGDTAEALRKADESLQSRLAEWSDTVRQIESEGRLLLFERLKTLRDEWDERQRDLGERLDRDLAGFRQAASERTDLGRRLMELGRAFAGGSAETSLD